jgi:nucleoside-diphosphate-sugar epimerase
MGPRVLVTGASGYIGGRVAARLAADGYRLRLQHRAPVDAGLQGRAELVRHDLTENVRWDRLVDGTDTVVHLAGRAHMPGYTATAQAELFRVNAEATGSLARAAAAAGIRHFVLVSSVAAMAGASGAALTEQTACQPCGAYGQSKLAGERAVIASAAGSAMRWTILRPPMVYGRCAPGNFSRLVQLVRAGVPLPFAHIDNRRSFVSIDNLVDAIAHCVAAPAAGHRLYLVADTESVSTPQLIGMIAGLLGRTPRLFAAPNRILAAAARAGDLVRARAGVPVPFTSETLARLSESLVIDAGAIRRDLGWAPRYSLPDGLARALQP